MKKTILALSCLLIVMTVSLQARAQELLFVHSPSCSYCAMWRAEVLPYYHKTDEGKVLPLRHIDLDEGMPKEFSHLLYPSFTPTFIVIDKNKQEVGRILGYDREFFWAFLSQYIKKMQSKPTS